MHDAHGTTDWTHLVQSLHSHPPQTLRMYLPIFSKIQLGVTRTRGAGSLGPSQWVRSPLTSSLLHLLPRPVLTRSFQKLTLGCKQAVKLWTRQAWTQPPQLTKAYPHSTYGFNSRVPIIGLAIKSPTQVKPTASTFPQLLPSPGNSPVPSSHMGACWSPAALSVDKAGYWTVEGTLVSGALLYCDRHLQF